MRLSFSNPKVYVMPEPDDVVPATAEDYEHAYNNVGMSNWLEIKGFTDADITTSTTSYTNLALGPKGVNPGTGTSDVFTYTSKVRPELEVMFLNGQLIVTVNGSMDDLDVVMDEVEQLLDRLSESPELDEIEYSSLIIDEDNL